MLADNVSLPKNTPIKFRLLNTVSSEKNRKGDELMFQLIDAVTTWSGQLLISKSSLAKGCVSRCKRPFFLGKAGELRIKIGSITAIDGTVVQINAEFQTNGVPSTVPQNNGTPVMSVAKGGHAELSEGLEFTALLPQDILIDPNKNSSKTSLRENPELYPSDIDDIIQSLRDRMIASADLSKRLTNEALALAPFDFTGVYPRSASKNIAEDISTALMKSHFKVVERPQMEAVLNELKLQHSSLVDPDTAKQIGKLTGADLLLLGSVSDRGSLIVINVRILETSTANCLIAFRKEIPYGVIATR